MVSTEEAQLPVVGVGDTRVWTRWVSAGDEAKVRIYGSGSVGAWALEGQTEMSTVLAGLGVQL